MVDSTLKLLKEVAACRVCEKDLPFEPRPIIQFGRKACVIIVGQAPGSKVHERGIPWDDASGDHLRQWLAVSRDLFYDAKKFALVPMGFCYPGKKNGGDAKPRPECAPMWHKRLLGQLAKDSLLLLVGQYAQKYYLQKRRKESLTETVRAYKEYLPKYFPLPHPSWRSKTWISKNPWFVRAVLPQLRAMVADAVRGHDTEFRRR